MNLECPYCPDQDLGDTELTPELSAKACPDCRGALLSLLHYREWRLRHASPDAGPERAAAESADDGKLVLRCPQCRGFMAKFRFSTERSNQIDHCDRCDLVWLDRGEWALVEHLAVNGQLARVFDAGWQKRLREEQARQRAEVRYQSQFGSDYERLREFRRWLAEHPKRQDALAYLYLANTDG